MADGKKDTGLEDFQADLEVVEIEPQEVEEQRKRAEFGAEIQEKKRTIENTVQLVENLDSEKSLSEQKEELASLEIVIEDLIFQALNKGEDITDIINSPLKLSPYVKEQKEGQAEAINKIKELILGQGKGSQEFKKRWVEICRSAEKEYLGIKSEKEKLEKGEGSKDTQWMSTSVRLGLMAAGAFGAYKLWKWYKKKKETGQKTKKAKIVAASIVTTIGVGAFIGPEKFGKWSAQYLGVSISKTAIGKFWENIKDGEWGKAFESLSFKSENPGIIKAAEKLKIDKKLIIDIKDQNFGEFSDFRADAARQAVSFAGALTTALGLSKGPLSISDEVKKIKQEKKLITFIDNNGSKIEGNINDMTVGEILNELESKGVFGAPEKKKEESPDEGEEPGAEEGGKSSIDNFIDKIRGILPRAATHAERFHNGEINATDAAAEITKATIEEGGAVVVREGLTFLAKGGEVILLSSSSIIAGTFLDVATIFTSDKESNLSQTADVLLNYFERGGGWWIGAGAIYGGGAALYSGTNPFVGAGTGALKGIRASYLLVPKVIEKGVKTRVWVKTKGTSINFSAKEYLAAKPEARLKMQRAKAAYHAEQYKYYDSIIQKAEPGGVDSWKARAYKRLMPGWAKTMRDFHGKEFYKTRTRFLKLLNKSSKATFTLEVFGKDKDPSIYNKMDTLMDKFLKTHPESSASI